MNREYSIRYAQPVVRPRCLEFQAIDRAGAPHHADELHLRLLVGEESRERKKFDGAHVHLHELATLALLKLPMAKAKAVDEAMQRWAASGEGIVQSI
jgi:hypothetical protein